MAAFDTSGYVDIRPRPGFTATVRWRWEDFSPFAQGYVEALFAGSLEDIREDAFKRGLALSRRRSWDQLCFSDLFSEALAMILRDCQRAKLLYPNLEDGGEFYCWRQERDTSTVFEEAARTLFPPLRVFLNDAGKVCLQQKEG